jgi:hypothetical protein
MIPTQNQPNPANKEQETAAVAPPVDVKTKAADDKAKPESGCCTTK